MRVPSALEDWASSGAMALTGRPDGPPRVAPGVPAAQVRRSLATVSRAALELTGRRPDLPGVGILGERAAVAGLSRQAPWSCGGAFRCFETLDGWWGVSLPRPDDRAMVPALVENDVADPWAAIELWASGSTTTEARDRAALLGMASATIPASIPARAGVVTSVLGRRTPRERPVVIDLTSLWAGPLCANILGLADAVVVKVESVDRPDGARRGSQTFFDMLHAGHERLTVDLRRPEGMDGLRDLIREADLVLESSRAAALLRLGLDAHEVVRDGTSWLSITAQGRESHAIGFGDDAAVGAGLYVLDGPDAAPCSDAIADPLTGVTAAAIAMEALLSDDARLMDVSMSHVVADCVGEVVPHVVTWHQDRWWVESDDGRFPVADPRARTWPRT